MTQWPKAPMPATTLSVQAKVDGAIPEHALDQAAGGTDISPGISAVTTTARQTPKTDFGDRMKAGQ